MGRAAVADVVRRPGPGVGLVVVVPERVVVVDTVGVVVRDVVVVVVVVETVPEVVGVGLATGVVGTGTVPDSEVEVEVMVGGGDGAVPEVVVADGALAVVVDVLATVVVVVVVVEPVDVVDVTGALAQEFESVTELRSMPPAAMPSWLVTAARRSLWLVTPGFTVTPGIVIV